MSDAESPGATGALSTLSVDVTDGGLRFRLDQAHERTREPLQAELHQRIEPSTLEALEASAAEVLRRGERPQFTDAARVRGGILYRTLVPDALRKPLRTLRGAVLVSSTLHGLPWELFHDGEEFWGLRYALGRRLVTDRPVPVVPTFQLPRRPRALVIGADPRGDLAFVAVEVEHICTALSESADVVALAGPLATLEAVSTHLARGFDLVHFAGHVVAVPGGESALLLGDGRPLGASVIERMLAGRPVVVVNGCASADTQLAVARVSERRLSGVVHGFLFGGAVAAVGTLANVGDRHAAVLAAGFYRHLRSSGTLGEALRQARLECRASDDGDVSPAWLAFALYGSPALSLNEEPAPIQPIAGSRRQLRPSRRTVLTGALLGMGATAIMVTARRFGYTPHRRLAIGVMAVEVRTGDVPEWMRTFTRHSLNTALREVHGIAIFSQEKIDFLCESRRLCGIAGAEALGMSKMITLSMSRSGDTVALDADVVDVARNGLLDLSAHVQGPSGSLIELQNRLVFQLLRDFGHDVTPSERERILSDRTNDMLDGYRMLMQTLGPAHTDPVPGTRLPMLPGGGSWVATAFADEGDTGAIRDVLRRYEHALTSKSVDEVAALQAAMTNEQRAALQGYFDNAKDLSVHFSDAEVLIAGTQALATYTREDVFIDARTGHPMRLKVRLSSRLVRIDDRWVLHLQ